MPDLGNIYQNNVISATSNPQENIQQLNNNPNPQLDNIPRQQTSNNTTPINPITVPIQIQPQIVGTGYSATNAENTTAQNLQVNNSNNNLTSQPQTNANINNISTQNNNAINPISNNSVKKSSAGTTIVTPITSDLNTVEGQYQSNYANTVNSLIAEMLAQMNKGFTYNPNEDEALKLAQEYATNSTLQSLAGSGVLNSTATAERVARIVNQLVVQYEEKAHGRWIEYLGNLANTAQVVMSYDSQQFQYWKDAKDREFQEKEFAFEKEQKELENTWKRVDELGYVDNEASALLGLKVGTLSKDAREAKEQREFELKKMREQAELEYENNKALTELRAELDAQQAQRQFEYEQQLYELKAQLDSQQAQRDFEYEKQLDQYRANLDSQQAQKEFEYEQQLKRLQSSLNDQSTEKEYKLAQQYSSKSTSSSSENYKTYDGIIQNRFAEYDSLTKQYIVPNQQKYNELTSYLDSLAFNGQITPEEYSKLCAKYARSFETTDEKSTTNSDAKQNDSKTQEKKSPNLFSGSVSALGNILQNLFK